MWLPGYSHPGKRQHERLSGYTIIWNTFFHLINIAFCSLVYEGNKTLFSV